MLKKLLGLDPFKRTTREIGDFTVSFVYKKILNDSDVDLVFRSLSGEPPQDRILSEDRAALFKLSKPLFGFDAVKIKGVGFRGDVVDFSTLHTGDYDLPHYDCNGNFSLDHARSFQRAYRGGMTYQQAHNEFLISEHLRARGFDTYPALGYGSLSRDGKTSWFLALAAPYLPHWRWSKPEYAKDLVEKVPRFSAAAQKRLYELGLHLVLHGISSDGQRLIRKDFHTSRFVSSADSFMSKVCYFFFDVNFELATFSHPYFETGIDNWVEFAWETYINELSGKTYKFKDIEAAKKTLVEFKHAVDLSLEDRLEMICNHELLRCLCLSRMNREEKFLFKV